MSNEIDEYLDKNKKHRQMMLLLKNKAEKMINKPSTILRQAPYINQLTSKTSPSEWLKSYQNNKADQHDISGHQKDKTSFYNSTLFRQIRQQSQIGEKSQFINNGSAVSAKSNISQTLQNTQTFKDSNLIRKIDELLMRRQKDPKKALENIHNKFQEKGSFIASQYSSLNSELLNYSSIKNQNEEQYIKQKPNIKILSKKLKTIQQQKKTLTIDYQQKQKLESAITKAKQTKRANKNPPLPSNKTIEKQKKKIQQAMLQLKEQKQIYQLNDKSSIILEFSDNQSENEQKYTKTAKQNSLAKSIDKNDDYNAKKMEINTLIRQKQQLTKQIQQIQRQLQHLQNLEQQQI